MEQIGEWEQWSETLSKESILDLFFQKIKSDLSNLQNISLQIFIQK